MEQVKTVRKQTEQTERKAKRGSYKSASIQALVIEGYRAGQSKSRIAKELRVHRGTVDNILQQPEVQESFQANMREATAKHAITAAYVVDTIVDTIERARQVRPVLNKQGHQVYVETPDGNMAPAYTFQPMAALKGCELLGKHLGMFTDNTPKRPLLQDNRLQMYIQQLIPQKHQPAQ